MKPPAKPSQNQAVCRRVLYSGHVQGVGFRYTVQTIARGRALGGYVRNLPDGKVEMLVEGFNSEVGRFLADVLDRMREYVLEARHETLPVTGEFTGFDIRK